MIPGKLYTCKYGICKGKLLLFISRSSQIAYHNELGLPQFWKRFVNFENGRTIEISYEDYHFELVQ